jgi:hypothetical protein
MPPEFMGQMAMALTSSRRSLIRSAVLIAGGAALLEYLRRQGEPPPAEWVRDSLWGNNLVAYAVWDGNPRAALRMGNRIQYDLMIAGDWFWPTWPPRPQWQLEGLGYSIAASRAPATVGWAPCLGIAGERCSQEPELFGQINDPDIVAMEVLIDGSWRRFAVTAPGFAVRLDGATGVPDGFRWLATDGRVIRETTSYSPTRPGPRSWQPRRRRPRATPIPPVS